MIPSLIPKRRKSRLKWAFTVLRAILSCFAISALSQPCNSNSTISFSRGPRRTDCSFSTIPAPPVKISSAPLYVWIVRTFSSTYRATLRLKTQGPKNRHFHKHFPALSQAIAAIPEVISPRLSGFKDSPGRVSESVKSRTISGLSSTRPASGRLGLSPPRRPARKVALGLGIRGKRLPFKHNFLRNRAQVNTLG